jgi:hypothetical protein
VFPQVKEQRCWFHYADLPVMPISRRGLVAAVLPAAERSA